MRLNQQFDKFDKFDRKFDKKIDKTFDKTFDTKFDESFLIFERYSECEFQNALIIGKTSPPSRKIDKPALELKVLNQFQISFKSVSNQFQISFKSATRHRRAS